MGWKKSSPAASTSSRSHLQLVPSVTLREESSGKKQNNLNVKSMLKLDHMKSLSIWASGEAFVPSLGALFGYRLAATAEALGVPPDPSLFSCQRCESILQPGNNCTVRIEKIKAKVKKKRKKRNFSTQNSVVYTCYFCSHQNLKRGTPKGYMKEICPPKAKLTFKSDLTICAPIKCAETKVMTANKDNLLTKKDEIASEEITGHNPVFNTPTTPLMKVGTLLDTKKKKRDRSRSKNAVEPDSSPIAIDGEKSTIVIASSKRKRKFWTSLMDIVERSEQDNSRNLDKLNYRIPYLM